MLNQVHIYKFFKSLDQLAYAEPGSHSFECVWYADWTIWLKLIQLKIIKFEILN